MRNDRLRRKLWLIKQILKWALCVAVAVFFVLLAIFYPQKAEALPTEEEAPAVVKPAVWTFENMVPYLAKKHGQSEELAREIIRCESKNHANAKNDNYDKQGNYWSSDHGYWQINDYYNRATAKARGYDIDIWQENLEYGFIMLKEQGTQPWKSSAYCWNA